MHSWDCTVEGKDFTVHHNGDYSGEVKIVLGASAVEPDFPPGNGRAVVDVPFRLLARIVADAIRSERIAFYEQAGARELLGLRSLGDDDG